MSSKKLRNAGKKPKGNHPLNYDQQLKIIMSLTTTITNRINELTVLQNGLLKTINDLYNEFEVVVEE